MSTGTVSPAGGDVKVQGEASKPDVHAFNLSLSDGALNVSYPSNMDAAETEEVLSMLTVITKRLRRQLKSEDSPTTGG